jgi:hypothetical protein
MTDDIFSELSELQRHASGLQSLIAAAQASAPGQAEGSDATGTVRATIGADGLPASIRVQDHWQRRLSGERFGAAVVEAFSAAAQQRMTAWTDALRDDGWQSKVDEVRADLDGPAHAPAAAPVVRLAPVPGVDRPRPLSEMLDSMVSAFDNVDALSAPPAIGAEGSGTSGYGKFAIGLTPAGLVSCVVDGQWASQQSADAITEAFDEALARAKADLTVKADAPDPAEGLDRILGEAMALLNDPERLAES